MSIEVDHLRLVRRQPTEMKRFRNIVLGTMPGEVSELRVVHEHDNRCCRREPWNDTARVLIEAMGLPQTKVLFVAR
jgi:hypothetical protein